MRKIYLITLMIYLPCSLAVGAFINSFNGGELSPLIKYRVDLDKQHTGAETMENLLVRPQGAAIRRPGTEYIANTKSTENNLLNDDFETWTSGASAAPDNWTLAGASATIARESTLILDGSYSAKLTRVGTNCSLGQSLLSTNKPIAYWKGKTVTFSAWVYATVADRAYLHITDGVTPTSSTAHTGNSTWQLLSVSMTVDSSAASLGAYLLVYTGNTSAYIDGAICFEVVGATDAVRMIPFIYSVDDTYMIEAGNQYFRFYKDGAQITSGSYAYEVTSPYTSAQIDDVHYVQKNDIMYFVHPDIEPYKLSRTSDTDWTMEAVDWDYPPFLDENGEFGNKIRVTFLPSQLTSWADATDYVYGDMVITSAGDAYTCIIDHTSDSTDADLDEPAATNEYWYLYYDDAATDVYGEYIERGATVQISTKQSGIFTADMVGSMFEIIFDKTKTIDILNYADTTTSDAYRVFGAWRVITSKSWIGTVTIQKSDDYGNTWTDYRTFEHEATTDANFDITGNETEYDRFYRFVYVETGGTSVRIEFTTDEPDTTGYVEITSLNAGASIPTGGTFDSYTDAICHYKLNTNAASPSLGDSTGNGHTATCKRDAGSPGDYNTSNYYDAAVYKVTGDVTPASYHFNPAVEAGILLPDTVPAALHSLVEFPRSVAFWFRLDTATGLTQTLFSIEDIGDAILLAVQVNTSGNLVLISNGNSKTGTTVLAVDTWYHCAVTSTATLGSSQKLYLNGDTEITDSESVAFEYNNDTYTIGVEVVAATPTFEDPLDGYIDNFSIYTGILSKMEIMELLGGVEAYGTVRMPIWDSVLADADGTTAWTSRWAEAAWSDYRGYPRATCIYQDRLCMAGTYYQPNGFWASETGRYENYRFGSETNEAISYEVGAAKQNQIVWLQDKNGVIAGTTGNVIRIYSGDATNPLSPSSIVSERQSNASSCTTQAVLMDDSIIYIDRNRRRLSDLIYDLSSESYVAPDLTIYSEHITNPGVLEMAVQERPDPILWCIRSDGSLLSFTYDKKNAVSAWTENTTDGDFENVGCIPGDTDDEVWVVVERTINSNTFKCIERLTEQDWGDDPNDCWFVDSGYKYTGAATASITGLHRLEGESVQVFTGSSYQTKTVTSGQITGLSPTITEATIGLPYTTNLVTFPIEVQTQSGHSIGYKKKISEIVLASYKSMVCQYGEYGDTLYDVQFDEYPDTTNGSMAPYTGLIRLTYDGGWSDETKVHFQQALPYPFGITGLVTKIEVSED